MLWAPLFIARASEGAPPNCIWRSCIDVPLKWIAAFLDGKANALERTYSLQDYLSDGHEVEITVDASPRGLGGTLQENEEITEYFRDDLTEEDAAMFNRPLGAAEGQQTWEALALLVALRLWSHKWQNRRIFLRVKSDSISALTMVLKMQARGAGPAIISREVALDVADALYTPNVAEHLPGVANCTADLLSRFKEKGRPTLPPLLRRARRAMAPRRDSLWWRTL